MFDELWCLRHLPSEQDSSIKWFLHFLANNNSSFLWRSDKNSMKTPTFINKYPPPPSVLLWTKIPLPSTVSDKSTLLADSFTHKPSLTKPRFLLYIIIFDLVTFYVRLVLQVYFFTSRMSERGFSMFNTVFSSVFPF